MLTTVLLLSLFALWLMRAPMANLAVTVAEVDEGAGSVTGTGEAGATITAGQWLYEDIDGKLKLASASALNTAKVKGVALHAALANQPVRYQKGGKFVKGATAAPAKGTIYVLSATAGAAAPHGDLATTMYATILGVGDGVSGIDIPSGGPFSSGMLVP